MCDGFSYNSSDKKCYIFNKCYSSTIGDPKIHNIEDLDETTSNSGIFDMKKRTGYKYFKKNNASDDIPCDKLCKDNNCNEWLSKWLKSQF